MLKPAVMVFDDFTAAIDAGTEQRIRAAMRRYASDRVTIIIAHRLSSLMHADQILFLEDGRIVERGTHEELLALGGRYRALYDLQVPARRGDRGMTAVEEQDERHRTAEPEDGRAPALGGRRLAPDRGGDLRQGLRRPDRPPHLGLRAPVPHADADLGRRRAGLHRHPARDPADHPLRHRQRHGGRRRGPRGARLGGRRLRRRDPRSTTRASYVQETVVGKAAENVLFDMRRAMFAHLQRVSLSLHGQDRGRPADVAPAGRRQLDAGVPRDLGAVGRRHRAAVRHRLRDALARLPARPADALGAAGAVHRAPVLAAAGASSPSWRRTRPTRSPTARSPKASTACARCRAWTASTSISTLYDDKARANLAAHLTAARYAQIMVPIVDTLTGIAMAVVIVVGGSMVLDRALDVGVMVAFLFYIQRFFDPIRSLTLQYSVMQRAMASGQPHRRGARRAGRHQGRARRDRARPATWTARSSSTTSPSATTPRIRCCSTSASGSSRARRWRWSARPARASRAACRWSTASTRCRAARSWSAATTCAT